MTNKKIKERIIRLLKEKDYPEFVPELMNYPIKKIIGILFSAILNKDEKAKWNAVAAFGDVVKNMCDNNLEDGKIFVRRLIWMLSDESGGIPWGVPEIMGEVLSRAEPLAKEYGSILINQVIEYEGRADLFVEYEPLRRGSYWGVARFSLVYPDKIRPYLADFLKCFELEKDLYIIAMGLMILKNIGIKWEGAKNYLGIHHCVSIFWDYKFNDFCINELAKSLL